MYLEAVPDDHWAPEDRFALVILLMICHDQINRKVNKSFY